MMRVKSMVQHGTAQAVVLAVVVFVVALAGHVPLGLAAALGAIMIAYGLLLLLGGRSEFISALARPSEDERTFAVHLRASAVAGNVLVAVIVAAFLVELARGDQNPQPWMQLGALFGVCYLAAALWFVRRG